MAKVRVLVLRAPGTNCDVETAFAFERAGAVATRLHVNRLLEEPQRLDDFQILCAPGGFSYGDDIAAGKIFANQMRHHLADALGEFKQRDKLILGICNGFQVLIKSGLLLARSGSNVPQATLTWNDSGRYEDRWVHLRVDGASSPILTGIESLYLPVAHAEGKFVASDAKRIDQWDAAGLIALRYSNPGASIDASGPAAAAVPYPENPNGSQSNVAGVCDETGRVLGLMPHPERAIDRVQHPRWTRGECDESCGGLRMFQNAVAYFG